MAVVGAGLKGDVDGAALQLLCSAAPVDGVCKRTGLCMGQASLFVVPDAQNLAGLAGGAGLRLAQGGARGARVAAKQTVTGGCTSIACEVRWGGCSQAHRIYLVFWTG